MHTARAQTAPAVKISHFEKSKMAQGGHLEKLKNGHISTTV